MANKRTVKDIVRNYKDTIDIDFVNGIIEQNGELGDFEMNKSTLSNICEWALDGNSDDEIRKKMALTPKQWQLLVAICPVLLLVMRDSRAVADVVIAGSLFQTAIGGKKVRKTVAKNVTEYDERGKPCGQHLETIELWEELPPNPQLLMFLATHKLSEKFGDKRVDDTDHLKRIADTLTPEQMALIEQMNRGMENAKESEENSKKD